MERKQTARLVADALRRPGLLLRLIRAAWRFRRADWYRRAPFLPIPPDEYVAWRLHTAYGDEAARPSAGEVDRYLRWALRMRVGRRAGRLP